MRFLVALALTCIFAVALWLRWPAIGEGMPYFYNEDEAHHFNRLVDMVKSGDLNPHYFHKPSLHFYLRIPVVAASFLWNVGEGHIRSIKEIKTRDPYGIGGYAFSASHPGIVKWNRAFSVALGLLLIGLVFLITSKLTHSAWPAIAAAFLSAVSPELIHYSGTIGVDVPMATLALGAIYAALICVEKFSYSRLLLCSTLAGFAISTKYNALPIFCLPIAVCLAARQLRAAPITIALIAPALAFVAATPYLVSSLPLFLDQIGYEIWHYKIAGHVGHQAEPGVTQALFYLHWLSGSALSFFALVLAALGFCVSIWKDTRFTIIVFLFPLLFFMLMIAQRANFERNMLVLIPAVAIAVGLCLSRITIPGRKRQSVLAAVVLTLIAALPAAVRALEQHRASITESRNEAFVYLQAGTSDSAVSGQLQFAPRLLALPGVRTIDETKSDPKELYLQGLQRLVASPNYVIQFPDLGRFFERTRTFKGEALSRIVRNPAIEVWSAHDPDAQIAQSLVSDYQVVLRCTTSAESTRCSPPQTDTPEAYLWLDRRVAWLSLSDLPSLPSATPFELSFTVMSPWAKQNLSLFGQEWSFSDTLSAAEGSWQTISIKVPQSAIINGRLIISIAEVHSPKDFRLSDDTRRLGLALR